MDDVDDILEHFGIKGMKWGVRKKAGSGEVQVITTSKGLKTTGGEGHGASNDAMTAAIAKQKARKSGIQSLDSKEMQALVNRMNLEQQYSKLNAKEKDAKKSQIRKTIEAEITKNVVKKGFEIGSQHWNKTVELGKGVFDLMESLDKMDIPIGVTTDFL